METTPEAARFLEATEARLASVLSHGSGEVGQSDTLLNAGRHLCIGSGGKRVRPTMVHLFGLAAGASGAVAPPRRGRRGAGALGQPAPRRRGRRRDVPPRPADGERALGQRGRGDGRGPPAHPRARRAGHSRPGGHLRRGAHRRRDDPGDHRRGRGPRRPLALGRALPRRSWRARPGRCSASAARPPGRLAGKDEVARRFETFGRHLGVAFQIADDLQGPQRRRPGQAGVRRLQVPALRPSPSSSPRRWTSRSAGGSRTSGPSARWPTTGSGSWAVAVLATDAPRAALTLMDREIDAALDALGPLRHSPGADQLTDWARRLGAAFR